MNARIIAVGLIVVIQFYHLSAQPSNATAQSFDAYRAFYMAVESGDLPNAREAVKIGRAEGKAISDLEVCNLVLQSRFFDRVCP